MRVMCSVVPCLGPSDPTLTDKVVAFVTTHASVAETTMVRKRCCELATIACTQLPPSTKIDSPTEEARVRPLRGWYGLPPCGVCGDRRRCGCLGWGLRPRIQVLHSGLRSYTRRWPGVPERPGNTGPATRTVPSRISLTRLRSAVPSRAVLFFSPPGFFFEYFIRVINDFPTYIYIYIYMAPSGF